MGGVASAYWLTTGSGQATAVTGTLTAATVSASAQGSGAVVLTFSSPAALMPGGSSDVTYTVERRAGGGAYAPVPSGGCAGTLPAATATCTDVPEADGSYAYRVVAAYRGWSATTDTGPVTVAIPPVVSSVTRADASPTAAGSVRFTVTFSAAVTGVDATDFTLVGGGLSGGSVTSVSGSGTTRTVTASTGSGSGTLELDVADDDSIVNGAGTALGGAGSGNGAFSGPAYTVDRTPPALQSLRMLDSDGDGKVDRVLATFDETLASSTATAPWTLTGVPGGGTLASVSVAGTTATLTLNEGGVDTAVGSFKVELDAAAAGITNALGNQASFDATAPSDGAAPVPSAPARADASPTNASTVHFTAGFSEPVTGVDAGDFAVASAGGVTGASVSSVSGSGASYAVTAGAGSGSGTLGLNVVDDGSIADAAGNPLGGTATGETYTVDRTPPALQSLEMFDMNPVDGKVDTVRATFDDAITTSTATAPWTLTGVPGGGTLKSLSTSGSQATLVLDEGSADTSVGSFKIKLDASTSGITDALGNQASFAATAPADKAGPVPTALTDSDSGFLTDGVFAAGDSMTVTFSEPVTGLPTSTAVTLANGTGLSSDQLTAPDYLAGTASLGSGSYTLGTATFSGSTVDQPTTAQARVTLGACSGLCPLTGPLAAAPFTYTPAPSITDAAGNAAAGSLPVTTKLF